MEFKVGELIVHPIYGMGCIETIEDIAYLGKPNSPYYRIAIQNGTIWVSTQEQESAKIRQIIEKDDLAQYQKILSGEPKELNNDRYQRKIEISERLKSGTFKVLCEIVRDLRVRSRTKSLNEVDIATLRKASENLSREWAIAEGISVEEATEKINSFIK
jgi:RNA polymerase-interacting CarD/CdnL/TRCF family regulator